MLALLPPQSGQGDMEQVPQHPASRIYQGDEIKTVHDAIDIYFILENIKTWIRIIHNFDLEGCINAVLKLKY